MSDDGEKTSDRDSGAEVEEPQTSSRKKKGLKTKKGQLLVRAGTKAPVTKPKEQKKVVDKPVVSEKSEKPAKEESKKPTKKPFEKKESSKKQTKEVEKKEEKAEAMEVDGQNKAEKKEWLQIYVFDCKKKLHDEVVSGHPIKIFVTNKSLREITRTPRELKREEAGSTVAGKTFPT